MPVSGPDSKARNETRQTGVVDIGHIGSTINVNMDNSLTHQDPIMASRQIGSVRAEEEKAYEDYSPSKGGVTHVNSQQQRAGIGSEPGPNRNSPVIKNTQPSSLPSSSVYLSGLSLSHDERSLDDMKRSRVIRGHCHQNRRSQSEHPGGDLGFAEKEQPSPGNGRTNDGEGNGRYDRSMLQVPTVENSMEDKLDQRPESCDISTLDKLFAEARRVEKYAEYCQQRSRSTDPAVIASFRQEMRERAQATMSPQMDDKSQDDVESHAAAGIDTETTTRPSFEHSTQARADDIETPRDRTRTSTTSTGPMIVDSNMVRFVV
ncbi:hypothetical protein KEM55_003906 [Ascosphaera atra]|nr:hypothetical protein KEM55_003906 [Ascosphaera atra]